MASRSTDLRRLRERLTGTPRLVLALVLVVAGGLVALTSTTPAVSGPVVVTTHGVTAGAVLVAGDVTVVRRAVADRPVGALTDPRPALGHRTVAALPRGAVVTASGVAPHGFTAGIAPDRAVATVAVAAARAGVVTVGDAVRLVVAAGAVAGADPLGADEESDTAPVTLAGDARVLAVWPASDDGEVATLVVDVDVGAAARLAVLPVDLLVGIVVVTA